MPALPQKPTWNERQISRSRGTHLICPPCPNPDASPHDPSRPGREAEGRQYVTMGLIQETSTDGNACGLNGTPHLRRILPAGPAPNGIGRVPLSVASLTRVPPKSVHVKAACEICRKRKIKVSVSPSRQGSRLTAFEPSQPVLTLPSALVSAPSALHAGRPMPSAFTCLLPQRPIPRP